MGQRICGKRRTGIARQDLAALRAQARRFPDRPPAPGAGTAEGHSATNELHTIIFKYLLRVAMPYRDPLTSSAHQLCPAASLIVLLLWIYYSSQIPFVGREFTHVSANRLGSPLTLPTCGNLVCLAELASRTQCRKARACDLLQLPDDCRAVDYHVISRYGNAIQATYWRSMKTAFVAPHATTRKAPAVTASIISGPKLWSSGSRHIGPRFCTWLAPVGAERQFRDGIEPV